MKTYYGYWWHVQDACEVIAAILCLPLFFLGIIGHTVFDFLEQRDYDYPS